MKIELVGKSQFLISDSDIHFIEEIKGVVDGKKVRGYNRVIAPIKSLPKCFQYPENKVECDDNVRQVALSIAKNVAARKRVVANIKADYPDNIKFDYDCKGKYKPLTHQKIMFNIVVYPNASAITADPGTCKTAPYIWGIDKRIQRGHVKKALIVTLSTLKENVYDEIQAQAPHLSAVVLKNAVQASKIINKTYKDPKKNKDYDIYIANYESMFNVVGMFDDDYFQMIVLDEAHRVGTHNSRQTVSIINKFENTKYKCIVTGSLHANNTTSFFSPFRFLGPDTVPIAKFTAFREEYMKAVDKDKYIWVPRRGTKKMVTELVGAISVYFKKEDCLDLPPLIKAVLKCDMNKEQLKICKDLENDLVTTIKDACKKCDMVDRCEGNCQDEFALRNAKILHRKLDQIASGFYTNTKFKIDENGRKINISNNILFDNHPKLKLLYQTLLDMPKSAKVIIWCHMIPAIHMIEKMLNTYFGKGKYLTCYGDQNAHDAVGKFKKDKYNIILANPTKMGVGHNIQFSNYQIFFNNRPSFFLKDQSIGRQQREGQKNSVYVIDLAYNNSADEKNLMVIKNKETLNITLSSLSRMYNVKVKGKKVKQ